MRKQRCWLLSSAPWINEKVYEIEHLSGALGAIVHGINLDRSLEEREIEFLKTAINEFEVIFFRNQPIHPKSHVRFARYFGVPQLHEAYGNLDGYPEITILENNLANPSKIEAWHADMTFRSRPPSGSVLRGLIIPERGGDTMFASMSAAFEGLSDKMQSFLSGLVAVHDFSYGFKESLNEPGGRERLSHMIKKNPPVEHPVICAHPESGKKGIFVNSLFTLKIKGMKQKESSSLLKFIWEHLTLPEFTCRFKWEKNSIAFWDNRITQHKPVNDYWPAERLMHRVTIEDGCAPRHLV